jgi:tetratricopeptide (TPR) repeat protein
MFIRALDEYGKALGLEHTSTLTIVNNMGTLYADQGMLAEAKSLYKRALDGNKKALGPENTSTLDTVHNLGTLYSN